MHSKYYLILQTKHQNSTLHFAFLFICVHAEWFFCFVFRGNVVVCEKLVTNYSSLDWTTWLSCHQGQFVMTVNWIIMVSDARISLHIISVIVISAAIMGLMERPYNASSVTSAISRMTHLTMCAMGSGVNGRQYFVTSKAFACGLSLWSSNVCTALLAYVSFRERPFHSGQ